MKKYLFGAAIMALAASCAETELDSISNQQAKLEGLTFKAELTEPETRAEWTKEGAEWNMFWYAERDQMDIYFKNATVNETSTALEGRTNKGAWAVANKAIYKASRTLGEGYFVAINNENIIDFTWNTAAQPEATFFKPSFRYVWPAATTVALDNNQLVATAPALNNQIQKELSGSSTIQFAMMSGKLDNVEVENENGSASDMLVGLKLQRNFPLAVYSVKNYDTNKDLYGKLKSITLSSLGQRKADGKIDEAAEKKDVLDYGTGATWNLETNKFTVGTTSASNSVKLTIENGVEWKDGATAFMTTNIVDRTENKAKSVMKIVYEFDNVQFVDEFDTKNNMLSHQVVRMSGTKANPDFDLRSQPYTLIKNGAADNYTLMINSSFEGKVADILKGTDVLDKYDNIASATEVAIADVTKLIVAPDVEDPTTFAKFTALTEVVLENEAKLEKGMFNATGLVSLTANKVTSVDLLFNANTAGAHKPAYTTLVMPSYEFAESKDINLNFFNESTKGSLATLNIAGVQDMAVPFEDITLAFVDYTALKNVTVKDGVNVSQNAFKGCTALDNFTGKVNLTSFDASNAFNGASALKAIEIVGTKVPAGAFKGCTALATVKYEGLTTIGANAFENCSNLKYMDLAAVTTLGESAFSGSALTAPNKDAKVLVVGATKIPAYAFKGTNVALVRFTAATEIAHGLLNTCNSLSQVRFDKAFDYTEGSVFGVAAFGTSANVTLYVDKANQKYVDGSTLKAASAWKDGAVTSWAQIEFKGIYDNAYWKE